MTAGNFDGVHRGHRKLLERVVERARRSGRPSCAYTFHPAPRDVLRPGNPIPRIQTLRDRVTCLGEVGIEQVVVEPFDLDLAAMSARAFADEILVGRLGVTALVLGYDFRFGRGRQGRVDDLERWLGVDVEQVAPYAPDGRVISSSRIREAVKAGQVEEASLLLGRPHVVMGAVVFGDGRGRELGFPTANLEPETALVPGNGVYVTQVDLGDGAWRPAVANVGVRPTFGPGERRIEVHLLDGHGDLYGSRVRARFLALLRNEQTFSNAEELVARIGEDVRAARAWLASHGEY
ncbi:MAG: riboflavin biosynthesis protein RibF, partial [Deltaproteobacteria bacterium]|nr:riboflavin biosynthesis protein RibF [Deltaproteobacteria bacterium]